MIKTKQLRIIILVMSSLVIVLGLSLYYVYGIQPMKNNISLLKDKLKSNQLMLATLQEQTNKNVQSNENLVELQKKIPVESFVDNFIMELRSREQLANSVIKNYTFTKTLSNTTELLQLFAEAGTGVAPAGAVATEPAAPVADAGAESASGAEGSTPEAAPVAVIPSYELSKLVVNLTLEAQSYPQFRTFLESIEAMERIIKVDNITFNDAAKDYSISLTTFFVPQFQGIKDQLPRGTFPAPSDKLVPVRANRPMSNPSGT